MNVEALKQDIVKAIWPQVFGWLYKRNEAANGTQIQQVVENDINNLFLEHGFDEDIGSPEQVKQFGKIVESFVFERYNQIEQEFKNKAAQDIRTAFEKAINNFGQDIGTVHPEVEVAIREAAMKFVETQGVGSIALAVEAADSIIANLRKIVVDPEHNISQIDKVVAGTLEMSRLGKAVGFSKLGILYESISDIFYSLRNGYDVENDKMAGHNQEPKYGSIHPEVKQAIAELVQKHASIMLQDEDEIQDFSETAFNFIIQEIERAFSYNAKYARDMVIKSVHSYIKSWPIHNEQIDNFLNELETQLTYIFDPDSIDLFAKSNKRQVIAQRDFGQNMLMKQLSDAISDVTYSYYFMMMGSRADEKKIKSDVSQLLHEFFANHKQINDTRKISDSLSQFINSRMSGLPEEVRAKIVDNTSTIIENASSYFDSRHGAIHEEVKSSILKIVNQSMPDIMRNIATKSPEVPNYGQFAEALYEKVISEIITYMNDWNHQVRDNMKIFMIESHVFRFFQEYNVDYEVKQKFADKLKPILKDIFEPETIDSFAKSKKRHVEADVHPEFYSHLAKKFVDVIRQHMPDVDPTDAYLFVFSHADNLCNLIPDDFNSPYSKIDLIRAEDEGVRYMAEHMQGLDSEIRFGFNEVWRNMLQELNNHDIFAKNNKRITMAQIQAYQGIVDAVEEYFRTNRLPHDDYLHVASLINNAIFNAKDAGDIRHVYKYIRKKLLSGATKISPVNMENILHIVEHMADKLTTVTVSASARKVMAQSDRKIKVGQAIFNKVWPISLSIYTERGDLSEETKKGVKQHVHKAVKGLLDEQELESLLARSEDIREYVYEYIDNVFHWLDSKRKSHIFDVFYSELNKLKGIAGEVNPHKPAYGLIHPEFRETVFNKIMEFLKPNMWSSPQSTEKRVNYVINELMASLHEELRDGINLDDDSIADIFYDLDEALATANIGGRFKTGILDIITEELKVLKPDFDIFAKGNNMKLEKLAAAFAKANKVAMEQVEVAELSDKIILSAGTKIKVVKKAKCNGGCGCGGTCKGGTSKKAFAGEASLITKLQKRAQAIPEDKIAAEMQRVADEIKRLKAQHVDMDDPSGEDENEIRIKSLKSYYNMLQRKMNTMNNTESYLPGKSEPIMAKKQVEAAFGSPEEIKAELAEIAMEIKLLLKRGANDPGVIREVRRLRSREELLEKQLGGSVSASSKKEYYKNTPWPNNSFALSSKRKVEAQAHPELLQSIHRKIMDMTGNQLLADEVSQEIFNIMSEVSDYDEILSRVENTVDDIIMSHVEWPLDEKVISMVIDEFDVMSPDFDIFAKNKKRVTVAQMHDAHDAIMTIEGGDASEEEVIAAFQTLIDSGLVWNLQGWYGRTAAQLIEDGRCTPPGGSVENLDDDMGIY